MIREPNFLNAQILSNSVQATFNRRGTPTSLTIIFDPDGIDSLQILWSNHLRGLGIFRDRLNLPEQIGDAINEINNWVKLNGLTT